MITLFAFTAVAFALAAAVLMLVRQRRHPAARAIMTEDGYQEVTITVNGRYNPDHIRVEQGTPVRLRFDRLEESPCSERVIFSGVGVDRRLPPYETTTIEFVPNALGSFLFTCQWGMYRGNLQVTEPREARRLR